jgi:Fe-S oxidoreductase
MGVHPNRELPQLSKITLNKWIKKNNPESDQNKYSHKLLLFSDEFINYNDSHIGITAIQLLNELGYNIEFVDHLESGRTYISKGILDKAKEIAVKNIDILSPYVEKGYTIIGIEPSAVLTLRDEYLDFSNPNQKEQIKNIAKNTLLIDEFLSQEFDNGNIRKEQFKQDKREIKLHGHCHQKALSSVVHSKKILSIPQNYKVMSIPSGCCGMAGSFGYEKEHYDMSMKIGELVLFPTIRKTDHETIIAAVGTSCRHQIKDGTDRESYHPVEILYKALC